VSKAHVLRPLGKRGAWEEINLLERRSLIAAERGLGVRTGESRNLGDTSTIRCSSRSQAALRSRPVRGEKPRENQAKGGKTTQVWGVGLIKEADGRLDDRPKSESLSRLRNKRVTQIRTVDHLQLPDPSQTIRPGRNTDDYQGGGKKKGFERVNVEELARMSARQWADPEGGRSPAEDLRPKEDPQGAHCSRESMSDRKLRGREKMSTRALT